MGDVKYLVKCKLKNCFELHDGDLEDLCNPCEEEMIIEEELSKEI